MLRFEHYTKGASETSMHLPTKMGRRQGGQVTVTKEATFHVRWVWVHSLSGHMAAGDSGPWSWPSGWPVLGLAWFTDAHVSR